MYNVHFPKELVYPPVLDGAGMAQEVEWPLRKQKVTCLIPGVSRGCVEVSLREQL